MFGPLGADLLGGSYRDRHGPPQVVDWAIKLASHRRMGAICGTPRSRSSGERLLSARKPDGSTRRSVFDLADQRVRPARLSVGGANLILVPPGEEEGSREPLRLPRCLCGRRGRNSRQKADFPSPPFANVNRSIAPIQLGRAVRSLAGQVKLANADISVVSQR